MSITTHSRLKVTWLSPSRLSRLSRLSRWFNKFSARVPVSVPAATPVSVPAEQKEQYRILTPGTTAKEVKTQKVQQNHRVDNVSMLCP
jgi:hypothetical protein